MRQCERQWGFGLGLCLVGFYLSSDDDDDDDDGQSRMLTVEGQVVPKIDY